MKHSLSHYIAMTATTLTALAVGGCIENDIPFPRIQANFLSMTAAGESSPAVIDSVTRTVTLYFGEETDIENVLIEEYSLTPGAHLLDSIDGPLDLSKPRFVDVRLYQNWQWSIVGDQHIERYFTVSGQVGQSYIDVPGRRVVVYVSQSTPLSRIRVETAKLGPVGSVTTPELVGSTVDLTRPLEVIVQAYGRATAWTIFAEQTQSVVTTLRADAGSCVAWVYGQGIAGNDNGFEYRLAGDTEWTRLEASDVKHDGGNFSAVIKHLQPLTAYQVRAYSDDNYGETLDFTTGSLLQMPNSSLDQWWLDGKVWNPWLQGDEPYWDTGNKGAATLGVSNSTPTDDTSTGTGQAARLETRFVGIGAIGKIAAGNLFVGLYYRTVGTNGILHLGRPYTQRPTGLRGYLKYTTAPINYADDEHKALIGQPDTCVVWCSLIDRAEPLEIRTAPSDRQLFDPNGSYVVAYGKIEYGQDIPEYIPFEIKLDYRSTQRTPTYLLVTASASKYGDYFTGGTGAVLYIDDLELIYDY